MGSDIPVIIITAYATVKNAVECTNLGAVAYLQKPFTALKVRSVLNVILNAQKNSADERIELANKQIEQGNFKEALRILKNALSEFTLDPNVYHLLSKASLGIKNEADALKYEKMYKALL